MMHGQKNINSLVSS